VADVVDLAKARIKVFQQDGSFEQIAVQYNPDSLSFDKPVHTADIAIPGLDSPLKQFVRGGTETATVELFFDTTETGTGAGAVSVTTLTDAFYGLVKIDPQTHAAPLCSFLWGEKFPGDRLPERYGNQRRTEFSCVVTSVKQDFRLFSPEGTPLRAVLTLKLEEYVPLDRQIAQLNLQSSDHTRAHVLEQDETLAQVAWQYLHDARDWRPVALENGLDDPRRLTPGQTLTIPPLTDR
jgi:nucleoid-associated protein YgaU